MTNELKQQVMDEIEKHVTVFTKVNQYEYRIRCPICGDSQKNPKDSHCYIRFSYDPGEPLLYHCFKCNSSGIVNKKFMELLHIKGDILKQVSGQRYNRIQSYKKANVDIITGEPQLYTPQTRYLERRLGYLFTAEELDKMKIIWDMSNLYPYISDQRVKNSMPNNTESVSFLSDDKSTILTRFFDDSIGRWRKIRLFPSPGKAMYTMKTTFDLFNNKSSGNQASEVWIAEGVMDILGIYKKRFNNDQVPVPDSIAYIAVLGSDYISGVEYAIAKGMFGRWVELKICIDSDVDRDVLMEKLKKYKWLFRSIYVATNVNGKDFGMHSSRIWWTFRKVI